MRKSIPTFKTKHRRRKVEIVMLDKGSCVPVGGSVSALKADSGCDVIRSRKKGEVEPPGYNVAFKEGV